MTLGKYADVIKEQIINSIIDPMYKSFFHAGTPFRNIVQINGKWVDE